MEVNQLNILSSAYESVTESRELVPGTYPSGTIVGMYASGANAGKLAVVNGTATDGTQIPYGIVYLGVGTITEDTEATVIVKGVVNRNKLSAGAGNVDSFIADLRIRNIIVQEFVRK